MAPDEVATKMIFQEKYITLCQHVSSRASCFIKVAEDPLSGPSSPQKKADGPLIVNFSPTQWLMFTLGAYPSLASKSMGKK
jgi:hypothetical protein